MPGAYGRFLFVVVERRSSSRAELAVPVLLVDVGRALIASQIRRARLRAVLLTRVAVELVTRVEMRTALAALEIRVVLRHACLLAVGVGGHVDRRGAAAPRRRGSQSMCRTNELASAVVSNDGRGEPEWRRERQLALDDDQILRRRPELIGFGNFERAAEFRAVAHRDLGVVEALS